MESIKAASRICIACKQKNASAHSAPSISAPTKMRGCSGNEFGSKDYDAELTKFGSNPVAELLLVCDVN
jgi:hypothetical protein